VTTASVELVRAIAEGRVPDLTAALSVLDRVDPSRLEPMDQVALVRAYDRCEAAVGGRKTRAVAAVADAYEALGMPASEARHEIGAALRLSPVTAADRTAVAVDLRNRFPRTLELLDDGAIHYLQAANLVRGTDDLSDDTARQVEDAVLARLPRLTPAETRRVVADAVVRIDPAAAAARGEKRREQRRIDRLPDRDGRTAWVVPMSVAEEGRAWACATRLAKRVRRLLRAVGAPVPSLDALRVDVVNALLIGADPLQTLVPASSAAAGGGTEDVDRRVPRCSCGGKQVAAVVVDALTLLGLADNPGRVPGHGLVPAEVARAMAADRDLVRWLVSPDTGELLDVGADVYEPTPRLQRFIRARDQRCGFPGCHQRADRCDIDHIRSFSMVTRGGKTIRIKLGPLCRQHHNAKTHGRWRLRYDPTTRARTWTSPLGQTYVTEPAPLRT
jgi:hypothetical protein